MQVKNRRLAPLPEGFHGDRYLLKLVDALAQRARLFVETGANVGSTLGYVARRYPALPCLSCEPYPPARAVAAEHACIRADVRLFEETSQEFLGRIERDCAERFSEPVLAWLDAHDYGFEWPLRDEVRFFTERFDRGYLLIDDFKVPHEPGFGFDAYDGQECSLAYVRDSIAAGVDYRVYYPSYREHTSPFHPLRGWGLLQFGPPGEELEALDLLLPDCCSVTEVRALGRGARAVAAELFARGEYARAASTLRAGLKEASDSADLWNDLGVCLAHLGDGAAALDALAKALRHDPDHPDARANLRDVHNAVHPPVGGRVVPVAPGACGPMVRRDPYRDLAELIDLDEPVIVDGGANRGNTVVKLRAAFPAGRVHAFEPIPALAEHLRGRFAADARVVVHQAALAASTGPVEFRVNHADVTSSVLEPSALARRYQDKRVEATEVVTVDGVRLGAAVMESVDVIKLDLQGFEIEALRGLGERLSEVRCLLTEVELAPLYDDQPLFADVDAWMRAAGFRLFHLYDLWSHADGQVTSADALFVNERFYRAA